MAGLKAFTGSAGHRLIDPFLWEFHNELTLRREWRKLNRLGWRCDLFRKLAQPVKTEHRPAPHFVSFCSQSWIPAP
jgi:hypothetical protein